jgi:hypothetical protein
MDCFVIPFLERLSIALDLFETPDVQFFELFGISLLGMLLIEDTVALAPQVRAPKATLAIPAIVEEIRIRATHAVPAEKHPITIGNVGTVVTKFVPMGDVEIG